MDSTSGNVGVRYSFRGAPRPSTAGVAPTHDDPSQANALVLRLHPIQAMYQESGLAHGEESKETRLR